MGTADMICRFSGLPGQFIKSQRRNTLEYEVKLGDELYVFVIGQDYYISLTYQEKTLLKTQHLVLGLILNGCWPTVVDLNSEKDFLKILSQQNYPKNPQEKLDNLFEYIFDLQNADGEVINFIYYWAQQIWQRLYFKDNDECVFYLKGLHDKGLIKGRFGDPGGDNFMHKYNITFDGLDYYNKITNEGLKSKNCFIAMSFSDGIDDIRQSIKNACTKTNYSPILIDETHGDSEKTINDEIIANIKKSKFCIADFTGQRDGVYFESGYALGRGLKVIYTCRKDDFEHSHFDTNHFPHIIYSTKEELEEKLINKIEAWIQD